MVTFCDCASTQNVCFRPLIWRRRKSFSGKKSCKSCSEKFNSDADCADVSTYCESSNVGYSPRQSDPNFPTFRMSSFENATQDRYPLRELKRQQTATSNFGRQYDDSDSDVSPGTKLRRAKSLQRCFTFGTSRKLKKGGKPNSELNLAVEHSSKGPSLQRLRSRMASFYSVISHCESFALSPISNANCGLRTTHNRRDSDTMMDDFDEFYSLDGSFVDEAQTAPNTPKESQHRGAPKSTCVCGCPAHFMAYDPSMPLMTSPNVTPGSYDESLAVAQSLIGHWVTMPERSESLDAQYRLIGLGMVKRAVMNRLAVPLTMFLEENNTILHCWIHTPLGIRHMRSNLIGKECEDDDPDAGKWLGTTKIIDYSIPWYCNGQPVRALQQTRYNKKVGVSIETRCVLPDEAEGKIMLFNFVMIPNGCDESKKLSADRLLRYVSDAPPSS